jgi:hypothetical protein
VFSPGSIERSINVFKLAAHGIVHNLRPRLIGLSKGDSIGVAWAAVVTESLVGQFGDVRTAHHDRNTSGTNRIRDAISLRDHSGHGPDAHQSDLLFADVSRDLAFVHWLRVAVNQQNFMIRRSQSFEQEHPKVRHEGASHAVVGIVQQNFHEGPLSYLLTIRPPALANVVSLGSQCLNNLLRTSGQNSFVTLKNVSKAICCPHLFAVFPNDRSVAG